MRVAGAAVETGAEMAAAAEEEEAVEAEEDVAAGDDVPIMAPAEAEEVVVEAAP